MMETRAVRHDKKFKHGEHDFFIRNDIFDKSHSTEWMWLFKVRRRKKNTLGFVLSEWCVAIWSFHSVCRWEKIPFQVSLFFAFKKQGNNKNSFSVKRNDISSSSIQLNNLKINDHKNKAIKNKQSAVYFVTLWLTKQMRQKTILSNDNNNSNNSSKHSSNSILFSIVCLVFGFIQSQHRVQ